MEDTIHCMICNKKFRQIHYRHVKQHGLTIEEYKQQFPDSPINSSSSSICRSASLIGRDITWADKISNSNKASWQKNPNQGRKGSPLSEESKKIVSQKLKGHSVSAETRAKIGISGLGREPWNKGLTKADDLRLLSISDKIRAWNKIHMTEAIKEQISQTLKQRYKEGMKIPQAKGNIRTDLGQYFRSKWEANYARMLNFEQISWEYEKYQFPFYDEQGKISFVYTPDFLINNSEFIEIKGHADSEVDWSCTCKRCDRDRLKLAMFLQYYPEKQIKIFGRKEYKELAEKYADKVNYWERTHRG